MYLTYTFLLHVSGSLHQFNCGTIKINSVELPKQVTAPARETGTGENKSMQHDNLVATVWQDNKQVRLH